MCAVRKALPPCQTKHQDLLSGFPALAQNLFPREMFSHSHILLTKQLEVIFQVFYLRYERPGFTILSPMYYWIFVSWILACPNMKSRTLNMKVFSLFSGVLSDRQPTQQIISFVNIVFFNCGDKTINSCNYF